MSSIASHRSNDQITETQSQAQAGYQQSPHDADTEKQIEDEVIQVKADDVPAGDSPSPPPPYSIFTSTQKGWILFIAAWAGWFATASSFIYFPAIPFLADDMKVSVQDINPHRDPISDRLRHLSHRHWQCRGYLWAPYYAHGLIDSLCGYQCWPRDAKVLCSSFHPENAAKCSYFR